MNIKKYLPKKEEDKILVQGYVALSIWTKVNHKRIALGITWNELILAACKAFLED